MIAIPDIPVGSVWETRDGVRGFAPRRKITVTKITDGKHHFDKGPTHLPADPLVHFTLDDLDGRESRCGTTAFRRTYVPLMSSG